MDEINAESVTAQENTAIAAFPPKEDARALTVVGLGGSAGSISALQAFFQNVPTDTEGQGSAYVVVLHLSPEHESHLAELLSRVSALPVHQVNEPMPLERNQVYVISPGKYLETEDGMLLARELDNERGTRSAVDTFFRTLAEAHGPQAVAVVLSGTGADGTLGIHQIKETGGLVVVQSPLEAEYDSMPRNAIATGLADYVIPAAAMPAQIAAYWETSRRMRLPEEAAPSFEQREEGPDQERALQSILDQVRAQTGHDFSLYKRATVLRRIGRRLQVNGLHTLLDYGDFLLRHRAEVADLVSDLLISVTQFFRDPKTWEVLERDVIPRLFQGKGPQDEVRAWVCSCATGEEAYSLAMLLLEQAARGSSPLQPPRVQVFATDMDAAAISRARNSLYPETIAGDVSEERLRRWFYRHNGSYQIRKEVREAVLCATHDVLRDTPFSRLDLVTCRNLLIYLNRDAQERVFNTFHFALRDQGGLLLGPSESAESAANLFGVTDKQHRIYIRRPVARTGAVILPAVGVPTVIMERRSTGREPSSAVTTMPLSQQSRGGRELFRNLLERYGPPTGLVDASYEILHLSNGAGRFLRVTDGEPTNNLLRLVHPELKIELRTALYNVTSEGVDQVRTLRAVTLVEGLPPVPIRLTVRPVDSPEGISGYFLIHFEEIAEAVSRLPDVQSVASVAPAVASADLMRLLEEENVALQSQLRSANEQHEAVTEELTASNEELQAINEEQRLVAEELETSKEELQSVNEELSTVNNELKIQVSEVSLANSDLQNFLSSTDIGTLFLDRALNVKRYTPAAQSLFNLIPTDIGRPLSDITGRLNYATLREDATEVLGNLRPVEREVSETSGGRHFLTRLLPYRSLEDKIEGVVITFVDITERKRLEEAKLYLATIVESAKDSMITINLDGVITSWNLAAQDLYGYSASEAIGKPLTMLTLPEDFQQVLRNIEKIRHSQPVEIFDTVRVHKGGQEMMLEIVLSPVKDAAGEVIGVSTIARDVTERRKAEEALRESKARLQLALDASAMGTFVWHVQEDRGEPDAQLLALFGLPPDGTLSLKEALATLIHPGDRSAYADAVARATDPTGDGLLRANIRVLHPDGSLRWLTINAQTLFEGTASRRAAQMSGVAADITEQKRAEEKIRESEDRLQAIANLVPDLLWSNTPQGVTDWYNQQWFDYTGQTLAEAMGYGWLETIHPEDRGNSLRIFQEAVDTGEPLRFEHRICRYDGEYRWFLVQARPLKDAADTIVRWYGTATDIHKERSALEVARINEAQFHTLSDAVPQVIWTNTSDGEADYFNQRWYEYSGLSYEDSAGLGWQAIVHPDDAPASAERWHRALALGEVFDTEYRLRRADGSYRWFIGRNVPLQDSEGRVTGWFGTATDIENLKRAEADLRESQERFRVLVEGAKDYVMFLLDGNGRIAFWNAGAERIFGWSEEEVLGQLADLIFTPEDREAGQPEREIRTAQVTGRATDRRWHVRKDGSRFWADGMLMRLDDENGAMRGFAKVARDATEQKRAEEAVQVALEAIARANEELEGRVYERTQALEETSEQLAEMSQMRQELLRQLVTAQEQERGHISRDLHDDTGQLVTSLLLGLNNLKTLPSLATDAEAQALILQLNTIAGEVAQKSHRLSFRLRPTALDDIGLMGALKNYTEEWSRWSGLTVELASIGLEMTEGDTGRLPAEIETTIYRVTQEALTNVLKHASESSGENNANPTRKRRGRKRGEAATQVSILIQRREGEVMTFIEDDGPGFDVAVALSQPPGKRRLGIFGMQERARLAGGTLSIESSPGKGTSVYLRLPVAQP